MSILNDIKIIQSDLLPPPKVIKTQKNWAERYVDVGGKVRWRIDHRMRPMTWIETREIHTAFMFKNPLTTESMFAMRPEDAVKIHFGAV